MPPENVEHIAPPVSNALRAATVAEQIATSSDAGCTSAPFYVRDIATEAEGLLRNTKEAARWMQAARNSGCVARLPP